MTAQHDAAFYQSVIESDLSVADGMPLVWISRLLNAGISERVAGSDLFAALSVKPRERKIRVFFFGGESGIAEKAHQKLNQTSAGMMSCGFYDPGFVDIDAMSQAHVIDAINKAKPDFLVIALGAKKGQAWIMHNRDRLDVTVISHLGAVINFVAGHVSRAPVFWQKAGMEWLWRITQEPALWRRYLKDGVDLCRCVFSRLLPLVVYQKLLKYRFRVRKHDGLKINISDDGQKIELSGYICKESICQLAPKFSEVVNSKKSASVTIDCAQLYFAENCFWGWFLQTTGQLNREGRQLFLSNLSREMDRLSRLSGVPQRFKIPCV